MEKENLSDYLRTNRIFTELTPEHLGTLAQHAAAKSYAQGELLFKQDDAADQFFVVRQGSVTVEVPSVYGPPLEVQTLGADEVLGWSWLIPPYTWAFEAKANTDSELLVFDGKTLRAHCEKHSDFGYALMKRFAGLMSERLQAARMVMMESWAPAGWA